MAIFELLSMSSVALTAVLLMLIGGLISDAWPKIVAALDWDDVRRVSPTQAAWRVSALAA